MTDAPIPPTLPTYDKPRERKPATVPKDLSQPHGIFNKVLGRILKAPKLKTTLRMMNSKKNPKPLTKTKKKKVV